MVDMKKIIAIAHSENTSHIRVLSSYDIRTNTTSYKLFQEFDNYYRK